MQPVRLRPFHFTCEVFVEGITELDGAARGRLLGMVEPIVASGLLGAERSFYWALFALRLRAPAVEADERRRDLLGGDARAGREPGHAFAYDFTIGMERASAFALGWNPLLDLFFSAAESAAGETQSYDQLHQGWVDEEAHVLAAATVYGIGQQIPAQVTNRWVGDEGERIVHEMLQGRGHQTFSLANRSNQGIDILAGAGGRPRYYFFEVKTSQSTTRHISAATRGARTSSSPRA